MAKKMGDLARAAYCSLTSKLATSTFYVVKVEEGRGILVAERATKMPSSRAYQAYNPLASALVMEGEMKDLEDTAKASMTLGMPNKVLAATLLTFIFFEVHTDLRLNRVQKYVDQLEQSLK